MVGAIATISPAHKADDELKTDALYVIEHKCNNYNPLLFDTLWSGMSKRDYKESPDSIKNSMMTVFKSHFIYRPPFSNDMSVNSTDSIHQKITFDFFFAFFDRKKYQ